MFFLAAQVFLKQFPIPSRPKDIPNYRQLLFAFLTVVFTVPLLFDLCEVSSEISSGLKVSRLR
ncbi:hypothetical protein IscW_ISCW019356 [Ixodes scapularis]|uniref:Uncharacterized protein n=1 Tax=Ixodes scapularis TaxID=6945 RepID=B7PTT7_IXOSC|nr:hypothetical protein IscW_ISCW019356 [Ixodes scapularis]|eukprot:XP_002404894.1 hypothetical protein IscW_ISCW019356 [Ixodes scapularis]